METGREITLEQLLDARERRAARQRALIEKFRLPLVSFTVNIPGGRKKTPVSSRIFHEGCKALMKKLEDNGCSPVYYESSELDTGDEAYFIVNTDGCSLKNHMLEIESKHPLGRLFDFDVIGTDGKGISREALGYPRRKCLLCEQDAHICGRSRRHSTDELLKKIEAMVNSY